VVDGSGHVIQLNANATGGGYVSATVNFTGGGGSGAQATANVDGSGHVTSYTVKNGGTGYATAPTATVVGGSSTGVPGGGGSTGGSGGTRGCVEEGTEVEVPEGTTEELLPCEEWIVLELGDGPLRMHPQTLVSVFKEAWELTEDDRIEVKGAMWRKGLVSFETRAGVKVKRTCPGGVYHAGPSRVRVHNQKINLQ
jgi:hypothetical protein